MEFLRNPLIKKEEWNEFVAENGDPSSREATKERGSFLQSWEWGNFQQQSGNDVMRVVVKENGRIALCAQILKYSLPLGKSYIYIPYGPIFSLDGALSASWRKTVFDFFIAELKKIANRASGIIFLKVEMDREWKEIDPAASGFRKSAKDIQARETMIMDLMSSEDVILGGMKQKTRYNIKIAQKHNVKIIGVNAVELDPQFFISMLYEMAARNGFKPHSKKYYTDMMNLFLGKPIAPIELAFAQKLYFAYYNEEVVAAALVGFFGGRATYLHGASVAQHRNVMAPYLLHWEIMREIKKMGFSEYDFWGIVTQKTDKKQAQKWLGFSRFKEGFGGKVVEYPGAYDLVFNKLWYNGYRVGRKLL